MISPSSDPDMAVADVVAPARAIGSSVQQCPLVGPTPPSGANFDEKFVAWTGMSVQDSINLYQAQTGNTLTPEEVQRLFTDPGYASWKLATNPDLHTVYRDILNTNVPATEEQAVQQGFQKLPWKQAMFHNPLFNVKYVGPDGHLEAIYDGDGNLVSDDNFLGNAFKGSFNFFGPQNGTAHTMADVVPWAMYGN